MLSGYYVEYNTGLSKFEPCHCFMLCLYQLLDILYVCWTENVISELFEQFQFCFVQIPDLKHLSNKFLNVLYVTTF